MNARTLASRVCHKILWPILPSRLKLPFAYWLHRFEKWAEPELLHLDSLCTSRHTAIDIGANIGVYSYRMSRIFARVFAFEINEELIGDLVAYNASNISVLSTGLSSSTGEAILYVPVLRGIPLTGWASLVPNNCPDTNEHVTRPVRLRPLDSFHISPVCFIKIDVEGHELEVLRGAIQTLRRCRPRVLVEVKECNLQEVILFFQGLHYTKRTLCELTGTQGAPDNYLFVPEEQQP